MESTVIEKEIKQSEIYLVPFPFSDFENKKVRPILILSNNFYNKISRDIIICGITSSNINNNSKILIQEENLIEGKLLKNSSIKYENITFIDKKLFLKKIAKINNKLLCSTEIFNFENTI